ncbi:ABC transporter ATP-binding protein/permease [Spiroplasma clarkii]|nr:ATP-binding cassette domain-containing protein [Spiroplasma clarkii]ARU90951.1 ABC transporter ATP-binding protein/permease [Spiroplasma clarkii]
MLINSIIAGISVGLVYLMAIFLVLIVKNYRKRFGVIRTIITDINGDVTDKIGSIKLVKSSGTRLYEEERIKKIHLPYIKNFKPVAKTGGWLITVLIISDVVIALATIASTIFIFGDKDPIYFTALITPFVAGLTALTRPLWQISGIIPGISRASTSTQRIYEVVRSESLLSENIKDGIKFNQEINNISFQGVSFAYPEKIEKLILPPTSLVFEKGKSYAFVGETGSGKSTISKLLLRFYDPTIGTIKINDLDLKTLNLHSYLRHVGYVEQEPQILYGDVYENVRYGIFEATNDDVVAACKKAGLHDLIESWPQKYTTILGEKGTLISGGQKQRIVIARIILKNPDLLILDEATSALDNIVEKVIQKELEKIMVNKTTIVIAHRLSTIKNVDKIFVLGPNAQGIVQTGTFLELTKVEGHFQKLYKAGEIEK